MDIFLSFPVPNLDEDDDDDDTENAEDHNASESSENHTAFSLETARLGNANFQDARVGKSEILGLAS
jgi:hypothetical protein